MHPLYRVLSRELSESHVRTEGTLVSGIELSCCTDYRPTLIFNSLTHSICLLNDSDLSGLVLLWRILDAIGYPWPDWHLSSNSFFLSFWTAICKRFKEHLVELMKDFSVESSHENTPCLEEVPSDSVVSEIVSPSETQSSECSEQDMEEWVNLLKWLYFNKEF